MALKEPHKMRVDRWSLEEIDRDTWAYNGELYSGYGTGDYFKPEDNAVVPFSYEVEFRDGKPIGWRRQYYANGNVRDEKLMFYETPMRWLTYDELGVLIEDYYCLGLEKYNEMVEKYNILD